MDTTAAAGVEAAASASAEPASAEPEVAEPNFKFISQIVKHSEKAKDLINRWDKVDAHVKGYYREAFHYSQEAMKAKKAEILARGRHDGQAAESHRVAKENIKLKILAEQKIKNDSQTVGARKIHSEILELGDKWFVEYCGSRGLGTTDCLIEFRGDYLNPLANESNPISVFNYFLKLYLPLRVLKNAASTSSSLGGGKRKRKSKRRKTQRRKKSIKKSKRKNFKKSNRKSKKKRRNKTKRR